MLLYEERPEYDAFAKLFLAFPPTALFLLLFLMHWGFLPTESKEEFEIAITVLISSIFAILAVYWVILPRKYEINEKELRIVMGAFSYSVPFETIAEVRRAESWRVLYKGLRFATSKNSVEIRRKRGMSVLISPKNPENFIAVLHRALINSKDKK